MSSGPILTHSMKKEDSKFIEQLGGDNQKNPLVSLLDKKNIMTSNHPSGSHRSEKNMSQTIGLFRKYLLAKAQHNNIGKTNEQESEAIERSPPRSLFPSDVGNHFRRQPSFLEQKLLPKFGSDGEPSMLLNNKSSKAQLTIFYSGLINVYDNVPIDKAHAIMLLAGESSSSNPIPAPTPPLPLPNLPSVSKLQEELPIARKHSLQRFLEKRRDRIVNKSPYASPNSKQENGGFSPSPLAVSAHMA